MDNNEWVAEIARLRSENGRLREENALMASTFHHSAAKSDVPCARCGGTVVEFVIPSRLWNAVIRNNGTEGDKEYLCYECWLTEVEGSIDRLMEEADSLRCCKKYLQDMHATWIREQCELVCYLRGCLQALIDEQQGPPQRRGESWRVAMANAHQALGNAESAKCFRAKERRDG